MNREGIDLRSFVESKIFILDNKVYSECLLKDHCVEYFVNDKINIRCFFIFPMNSPCLLFCHGIYMNISQRPEIVELARKIRMNVVLLDYKGYGKTKGKPSLKSILDDGLEVYRWLINKVDPRVVVPFGESMGGSVASYIARYACLKKIPIPCVVLFSSIASLDRVLTLKKNTKMKILGELSKIVLSSNLPTCEFLKNVKCPVLIIHSPDDRFVVFEHALENLGSCRNRCKLIQIKGDHTSPKVSYKKLMEIEEFIRRCCQNIL